MWVVEVEQHGSAIVVMSFPLEDSANRYAKDLRHAGHIAGVTKYIPADEPDKLVQTAKEMIAEPLDLDYPQKDVYGYCSKDEIDAPFWSESGLYGRVGKEAGRTLLVRRKRLCEALGIADENDGMEEPDGTQSQAR
jgi:hypothetical protein